MSIPSYSEQNYVRRAAADLAARWTDVETKPGPKGVEQAFTHDAGAAPFLPHRDPVVWPRSPPPRA